MAVPVSSFQVVNTGGHLTAVLRGAEAATAGPKVRGDAAEGGQEPLGVPG
ncbi:MAG: hypothetical protein LC749_22895 [Actinobacteria bacterium]|nr:hypothetical protein [Actinomycetota bacterium]